MDEMSGAVREKLTAGLMYKKDHMKGAKVTLIRVPSLFARGAITLGATPPVGLAYLAGNLRTKGFNVSLIDSVGEAIEQIYYYGRQNLYVNGLMIDKIISAIPKDSKYIGLSFPFSHEWSLYSQVTYAVKDSFPRSVVICGGEHATALPHFCLQNNSAIDYCVLGEGENTLAELIDALESSMPAEEVAGLAMRGKNGKINFTARRKRILDIDSISQPAWDLTPIENYLGKGYSFGVNIGRSMPIIATRGCPYRCTFCSNLRMWEGEWRFRSPRKVVDEMEEYVRKYSAKNFDFYDLTAIVRKDWTVEFCNLLIERKMDITWQLPSGTRSEALDKEVTKLLYKSGCRNLTYAPESGSQRTLKRIKKKAHLGRMLYSIKGAVANRLNVKANIIVGFPGERLKDLLDTYIFIIRMAMAGLHDVTLWTFVAYPGSEIFNNLKDRGDTIRLDDDYFVSLLSYSDLRRPVSWNEHFSHKTLNYARIFGLLLFYGFIYLIRPGRLFRSAVNLIRRKPKSRMEMIIGNILYRHQINKRL